MEIRKYSKAVNDFDLVFENDSYGSYNKELPEEARQFDFLIGEWIAHHLILLPNGNYVKHSTAIIHFIISAKTTTAGIANVQMIKGKHLQKHG